VSRQTIFLRLLLVFIVATLATARAHSQETHLYWGDTHLHTSNSIDAFMTGNINADPDTAYRFARGLPVLHPSLRTRVRILRPLDFLVVSDHAELMSLQPELLKGNTLMLATEWGKRLRAELQANSRRSVMNFKPEERQEVLKQLFSDEIRQGTWAAQVDAAERNNEPGKFTAFAGWEWSSAPGWKNLHRVIFSPSDAATLKKFIPFSSYESQKPEDLWKWLEKTEKETGVEFIAIPHNSNLSGGLMFDMVDSAGRPITAEYARTRMRWEPVVEVTQVKGTSEVLPELSPNDEFAEFEIRRKLLTGTPTPPNKGDYVRYALQRGLEIEQNTGVNPYKFGMIGSSDSHTGLSSVEESDFLGKLAVDALPQERYAPPSPVIFPAWEMSASGIAGVWATANTREAIAAAFKRKEVYATTGPRISLRVFGGYSFRTSDAKAKEIAKVGYSKGVPMGGDLWNAPKGKGPTFLIYAVKDPISGNLDRIQVIKGWLDASGQTHEHVYNAAWAGDRKLNADGKLPPVGNTVDVQTASFLNTIGAAQLATVWKDPEFSPTQRAFYYIRVIEIPTPRHQVYDAVALGIDNKETHEPATIQERAFSSPIWYTPRAPK
jgi:Protein of unknown function (DUF3604)